jgi:hypothetical protein
MRTNRLLPLILVSVVVGALIAGASASAAGSHTARTTTLKYFFKSTGQRFTSPSGAPVSNSAPPAVGDTLIATEDAYAGDSAHHAKTWTASAALYCTITKLVSNTNVPAHCEGVVAIGGSMLISISTQNFGGSSATMVYPITGGAGKYLGAKGTLTSTNVGNTNNSNVVVKIKG